MLGMVAGMAAGCCSQEKPAARRSRPGVVPAPGKNLCVSARAPTSAADGSASCSPSSSGVPTSVVVLFLIGPQIRPC